MFGRNYTEDTEESRLAPYAEKSGHTRGRRYEPARSDPHRTDFQRDRDRILYSVSFRRLKYKTQVYVVGESDFYRTRLTHSLEVMQHARTLARALGANEDLVEAISYAHDLGHPPFGHAAEDELNRIMASMGGFDHNRQGLRVVDQLEKIYPQHPGLDLTWETREGLARHHTAYDRENALGEFSRSSQPSLECQIVNLADELAFVTHDLEDALSGRLIGEEHLLRKGLELVAEILGRASPEREASGGFQASDRRLLTRNLIHDLSVDAIAHSRELLSQAGVQSPGEVRDHPTPLVSFSPEMREAVNKINAFLLGEVYQHPRVLMMARKGVRVVRDLHRAFSEDPRLLPGGRRPGDTDLAVRITDFIAGMTDRYALELHRAVFDPHQRILRGI